MRENIDIQKELERIPERMRKDPTMQKVIGFNILWRILRPYMPKDIEYKLFMASLSIAFTFPCQGEDFG